MYLCVVRGSACNLRRTKLLDSAAGQAGILTQPLACSRRTTEACTILSLDGLWVYGVTLS